MTQSVSLLSIRKEWILPAITWNIFLHTSAVWQHVWKHLARYYFSYFKTQLHLARLKQYPEANCPEYNEISANLQHCQQHCLAAASTDSMVFTLKEKKVVGIPWSKCTSCSSRMNCTCSIWRGVMINNVCVTCSTVTTAQQNFAQRQSSSNQNCLV